MPVPGFLATGLALAVAAVWGRRSGVIIALVAYVGLLGAARRCSTPSTPRPACTDREDVLNVLVLVSGLVFAAVLAWGAFRSADR